MKRLFRYLIYIILFLILSRIIPYQPILLFVSDKLLDCQFIQNFKEDDASNFIEFVVELIRFVIIVFCIFAIQKIFRKLAYKR